MTSPGRVALFLGATLLIPACGDSPFIGAPPPAFELSSPANTQIGVPDLPVFQWTPSVGAASYTIQVSTDSAFSTFILNQSGITATSFSPAAELPPGTVLFWRVLAEQASGSVTAEGSPGSFTTLAPVPGDFGMIAPENRSLEVSLSPTFSWTASLGTASYTLEVALDSGFETIVFERSGMTETSVTPTTVLLPSTVYFWKVSAESVSVVTATGAPWSFTTRTATVPGPFQPVAPPNGMVLVSTLPTFVWTSSAGALTYRLQVSTDPSFASVVVDQAGIPTVSVTPSVLLSSLTIYYWRVFAVNGNGSTLASPTPLSFETD